MSRILPRISLRVAFTVICLIVFTSGVVTYSAAYWKQSPSSVGPFPAFTLTVVQSEVDSKGVKTPIAFYIKEVAADGSMVVTRYSAKTGDWSRAEQSLQGRTVSTSDGSSNTTNYPAPRPGAKNALATWRTESFLQNHPGLVGRETILGLNGYKIKRTHDDGTWSEFVQSPKTGDVPLKQVFHRLDGTQVVSEAIHIVFN